MTTSGEAETDTSTPVDRAILVGARRRRLERALGDAEFDAFLAVAPPNVDYATGYRSVAGQVHGTSTLGALVTPGRTVVAGPVADAPSVVEAGIAETDYFAHGRFFFESTEPSPITQMADDHDGFVEALVSAVRHAGLAASTIGVDTRGLTAPDHARLVAALPDATLLDASTWARGVRGVKLAEEVGRLRTAARITEEAIHAGIDSAHAGMSETDLQLVVASHLALNGMTPRFVVATVGERSAYSDTPASPDKKVRPGDLIRFDVGGLLDGYWSDLGRTAVVGEPDDLQRTRYDAILEGEVTQLELARPGVLASDVFKVAVDEVERRGITPYRRHHCGHGIGLDVYEAPIIAPDSSQELEAGMVFCFETPFYELGWGGMMVEDTLVITDDGCELLSVSDRSLRVVQA
jgi:Xaa-Pro aminopeptidase